MTVTDTATPRIYVACLAAYNNGILHGQWIDADQDAEDIHEEIQRRVLKTSPIPGAEEWAIHDHEYLGGNISEYESIERIAEIGQAVAEHGEAFIAFLGIADGDEANGDTFQERYQGEWGSERDFAEGHVLEYGWGEIPAQLEVPTGPYGQTETVNIFEALGNAIDMDYIAHELFDVGEYHHVNGYVFRSH